MPNRESDDEILIQTCLQLEVVLRFSFQNWSRCLHKMTIVIKTPIQVWFLILSQNRATIFFPEA